MGTVLKVGIVGLGKMGRIRAAELAKDPRVRMTIGADPDPNQFGAFPGVHCTQDYREVIYSDVDIVFVCTPNRFTANVVIDALDAGKHVFAEKPPGRSVEDIEAVVEAEKRNPGLKLKFGFNHRYHAGIQEAKRIVDSGRLGRILWLRGIYGKAGGPEFKGTWRSRRDVAGGGILLDQGIHMLDLFRFFSGDFDEVKSMVTTAFWDVDVEDNAFALLRDSSGRVAMIHSSATQWKHRFNFEIFMSEGYVSVNGILSSTRSYGDETITVARNSFDPGAPLGKPREEIIYFDKDPSWELEVTEFINCVVRDEQVLHGNSADALAAMKLVYAIYNADSNWAEEYVARSKGEGKDYDKVAVKDISVNATI